MKKLLTIPILLITLMFSSTSYAEWTKVSQNVHGVFYVDFMNGKKDNNYSYYWYLHDFWKPNEYGNLSQKIYIQVDCKIFRIMFLTGIEYEKSMGKGNIEFSPRPPAEWFFPPPNNPMDDILKSVCVLAK